MENEQQPTYEQLVQAYTNLLKENEQLNMRLNVVQTNNTLNRIKLLVETISTFDQLAKTDASYKKILNNAKWHLEQMLAKPKTK